MPLFRLYDYPLFRPDSLTWVMACLIVFINVIVIQYASRYLAGDRNQRRHRGCVLLLAVFLLLMVFADHLFVFLAAWTVSNFLLVRLMVHTDHWIAACNSGLLALKTLSFGSLTLSAGFFLLAQSSGTASISTIVQSTHSLTSLGLLGLLLIAFAAMIQSAVWPFHRWLLSSLNSPTPVSALMHAGIVNGGGFLLVRFSPLYTTQPEILHGLFAAGLITAVVGTFWKLLQTDIKRMLACSTMGQMGFMVMQCGMGLFAPAISHLCWHGLFKSYLFLSAGSVVQEKRSRVPTSTHSIVRVLLACFAGVCGAVMFALVSGSKLTYTDTSCVMIALAFMAATQLALGMLDKPLTALRLLGTLVMGVGAGGLYGLSIRLVEAVLGSMYATRPQSMDPIYFLGIAVIILSWLAMILNLPTRLRAFNLWKRLYLAALNASQPHPQTVTATRTAYQP